ncbi:hypothetical protein M3611_02415 [Priestia megaterium]|uniref:hypothetical protein n=1 Tax=Priestia megaterium TaxID=1404 RepID=UPI00203F13F0|nr:hypothetical protein [Priestia megaterium]MCM3150850.1 hypothetical protein [Priestia megaterium]
MKIVIVNCFDTYKERINLIYEYFVSKGNEVHIVHSNYMHFKKDYIAYESSENYHYINTRPYKKNLSIARLLSHYQFATDAFKKVEELQPDILYAVIPPNSIAKKASDYKERHTNTKLVFDLIDLWPETMPFGNINSFPPFILWKNFRDTGIKNADLIITECNLYQSVLRRRLRDKNTQTLYLAKEDIDYSVKIDNNLPTDIFNIAYLGSINNIIDLDLIPKILKELNEIKPTYFHIIGDGESKEKLITKIMEYNVKIIDHGKVYDYNQKKAIFDKCHYGLNIMKESVCVGLTMKSIDYFQHGLPIINNIQADTTYFVENYNIGFNINSNNVKEVSKKISLLDTNSIIKMKQNSKDLFTQFFSETAFKGRMDELFSVREGEIC